MKKFERFIIYPLLIVALFYAVTGGAGTETLANPFNALNEIDNLTEIIGDLTEIDDVTRVRNIVIYNDDNEKVGRIGSNDSNDGAIRLYNREGNETLELGTTAGGQGSINVSNHDCVTLTKISNPLGGQTGSILIKNSREDTLMYMGANTNGHGLINIYDRYGEHFRSYSFR